MVAAGAGCGESTGAPEAGAEEEESVAVAQSALQAPVCVTVQRGVFGTVQDTFLSGDFPGWAAGGQSTVWSGLSSGGGENRVLVAFDLSFLSAYAIVTSATFRIRVAWNTSHSVERVHRVTQPWTEATATLQSFGAAGFEPAVAGSFDPEGSQLKEVDLTELVHDWVRQVHPNYGVILEEDPVVSHLFYSSESSPGNRPSLEVCYVQGPKPHRGGALVAGGTSSDSESYHFVGSISEGPGQNRVASSVKHRFIGGVVGATQE